MKLDFIEQAMQQIRPEFVAEAAQKPSGRFRWVGPVAAVLAVTLTLGAIGMPKMAADKAAPAEAPAAAAPQEMESVIADSAAPIQVDTPILLNIASPMLAAQAEPRIQTIPALEDYQNNDEFIASINSWQAQLEARSNTTATALKELSSFFRDSSAAFLENDGENRVWSPVNGYIALAMLAEATDGQTRQQILDTLGISDMDRLRTQVSAIWESTYHHEGEEISYLSNSLWLDQELKYREDAVSALGYHHYASVYHADLGSDQANRDLQTWINHRTGNLLTEQAGTLELPEDTALALASTVYLQSKWIDEFYEENNTEATFHSPQGDVTRTFMNRGDWGTRYYWGDTYGAVNLWLHNGTSLWLYLPDEGRTPQDILKTEEYLRILDLPYDAEYPNRKYIKVNLSLPKFDIASSADLCRGLQALGITDVFDPETADFSALVESQLPVWVDQVHQAARVRIDEEGAEAASYVVEVAPGAAMPPEETMDFVLDRPFLFVVEKNGIPLFTGIVNEP